MYKNKMNNKKFLSILILCLLFFPLTFWMNPGFIRKDINNNLRTSQYESDGLIALWSGPLNTIPAGWKLCNGTDGTIDTTNLFAYSTDSGEAPGDTGGDTTHSHIYETVPSHDHGVTGTTYTPHSHTYLRPLTYWHMGTTLWPYNALGTGTSSTGADSASHNHGGYTSYTGPTPPLYTAEEENIPPYYEMAFIEKEADDTAIPSDLIVMWGGDISSIPAGWELCNGSNGTPDLRDKFIRGAPPGEDPGTLGGTIAHDHTYTQIPRHRHTIDSGGSSHSHGGVAVNSRAVGALIWTGATYIRGSGYTNYGGYTHTHSVPTIGLTTSTTANTNNQPPYFKVAFIMNTVVTENLPLGAISMWGDSIANIPSGWNQCTGTSGTPNMLERFPKGVATGEQPGLIGGNPTHRHTYTAVPLHTHTIPTDPMNHRHSIYRVGGTETSPDGSLDCWWRDDGYTSTTASSNPSHNHDINPFGSTPCYTAYDNSLPSYVKLIYIQKGQSTGNPTPANGATDINYNPTLSVFVIDLEGDDLTVSFYDASDDSLIGSDIVTGGNGTASEIWSDLSSDTVYSWYIKTDDGGPLVQSATWSFTTNYEPDAPTNPTPNDGATDINFNPTLSVDVFDNDGDIMNVSFYDASDDSLIGWEYIFGGSGTASATWSGLTNDTIFSWYAKSDDGLSIVQSATWSFTTNYAPDVPINPTPSDGAIDVNYSPTLSVDVFDNDGDDLTVSFYNASDDSLIDSELVIGGNGTAYVLWSGLLPGNIHSWYTTAYDGLNIGQSATWSFTTNYEPDAPTNPTPNDGATDISDDPTLSVDVFDFDGDIMNVSFYDASDDSLIDSELILGGSGTASVTWTGLSSITPYSWYAISDDGLSAIQSATWSFTTGEWIENHLPQVTNPTPNNGATDIGDDPTLSVDVFDEDGDTVTVTFYNASDNSEIGSDIVTGGSGTASVTWSGVTSDMVCQWYVRANDGKGATESATWTFLTTVTSTPPGIPLLGLVPLGLIVIGTTGILSVITYLRRKRLE
ncbi:MAG: hypothetical protein KGD58_04755 [Candidatus Lokiarchaeota archaeon]|nr:hypothetical protein [Candidatus Lokiarchaeota archaeon]